MKSGVGLYGEAVELSIQVNQGINQRIPTAASHLSEARVDIGESMGLA